VYELHDAVGAVIDLGEAHPAIKVAKGKNKLPTTIKEVIKKFKNG